MSNGSNNKRTLLDRSIVTILQNPDQTRSRKAGIRAAEERLYRLHGTSLIAEACRMLTVPQIHPTATTLFHRFYHQVSLKETDVWSTAMACTLLAAKIEEPVAGRVAVRNLVLTFVHLYRRRTLVLEKDEEVLQTILKHEAVAAHAAAAALSLDEKFEKLRNEVPALSLMGPVWKEWHDAVVQAESRLLRQLGFTFYWIPNQHPHRFVPHFCNALLEDDNQAAVTEAALQYCNLSCRLDLCVRHAPETIACAAIYLALLDRREVVDSKQTCWWHVFCGSAHDDDLSIIGNAILGLRDRDNGDVRVASRAFLKSHLPDDGSFNDPRSFVWEMMVATNNKGNE